MKHFEVQLAREKAFELWRSGQSIASIAAELGCSRRTANRYILDGRALDANWLSVEAVTERRELNELLYSPKRSHLYELQETAADLFRACIKSMTSNQYRTFVNCVYLGYPVYAVAQAEGVSEIAICRRLQRINRQFRKNGLPVPKKNFFCDAWEVRLAEFQQWFKLQNTKSSFKK